jgi:CBS domain-containing protein
MRISDVLRVKGGQVVTVTPDTDVRHLLMVLAEHRIGAVVVSHNGPRGRWPRRPQRSIGH